MVRPSARSNLLLWEFAGAFMLITCAGILHVFHFFNNAWLQQLDGKYLYMRGLGDDCLRNADAADSIYCSEWGDPASVFIKYGPNITQKNINAPSAGLSLSRVMIILAVFIYVAVIFLVFVACVKQDLLIKKLLCGVSILLIFNNTSTYFFLQYTELGKAFYYYLFSILLLCLGSLMHYHTWLDVYNILKTENNNTANLNSSPQTHIALANNHALMNDEERIPSFISA
uniref:Uncharacterized protein n=1 Tax=Syphacia muris TaxID=451379 RepID=A0A0N5AQH9_9BILA